MQRQPRKPEITGTREWSVASANCYIGCKNDCRYCYARKKAFDSGLILSRSLWKEMRVDPIALNKKWRKFTEGAVMFPTQHDIFPENLEQCERVLFNILTPGNYVLLVSKPHEQCIRDICSAFKGYKDFIEFRFTIGALSESIREYWEPNAPPFRERIECLDIARVAGFRTSVSVEPMLSAWNIENLVAVLMEHTKGSVWVGRMNQVSRRVEVRTTQDREMVNGIINGQTNAQILDIYKRLQKNPQVRWKESIKKVVGLPLATRAGLDE